MTAVVACPSDPAGQSGDGIAYIEVQARRDVDPSGGVRQVPVADRSPAEAVAVYHELLATHDPQLYTVRPRRGDGHIWSGHA